MSDIIHLVPETAEPGPGTPLADPSGWVLGEKVHDSGVLHAYQAEGLVWVLADLSQREAMVHRNTALAKLRHPQIQAPAGIGLVSGWPYRADAPPEGVPLDVICQEQGPFTVERSLDLALQLAELLVELHGRGVVHGHVHPGAMRLEEERLTLGDIPPLLGLDLPYAAPEVQLGAEADPRSDLFGLGYTTLCLLRGSRPDGPGRDKAWRTGKPGPIAPLPPAAELPHEIAQLLNALVDRDPERRPRSALEVSQILARARAPARKPPSFKIVGLALGGVLLFGTLNLAYEAFNGDESATPEQSASQVMQQTPEALQAPTMPAPKEEPLTSPEELAPDPVQPGEQTGRQEAILRAQIPPTLPPMDAAPAEATPEQPPAEEAEPEPEMAPEPTAEEPTEEPAEEPAIAEVEPEPQEDPKPSGPDLSHFSGTYSGSANGRPLRMELTVDANGNARGIAEQSLGSQVVRTPVRGTFAEDGRFTLVETEGPRPNTWTGSQNGHALNGTLKNGGRSRGQWSASR